jgi:hypothetical protein
MFLWKVTLQPGSMHQEIMENVIKDNANKYAKYAILLRCQESSNVRNYRFITFSIISWCIEPGCNVTFQRNIHIHYTYILEIII